MSVSLSAPNHLFLSLFFPSFLPSAHCPFYCSLPHPSKESSYLFLPSFLPSFIHFRRRSSSDTYSQRLMTLFEARTRNPTLSDETLSPLGRSLSLSILMNVIVHSSPLDTTLDSLLLHHAAAGSPRALCPAGDSDLDLLGFASQDCKVLYWSRCLGLAGWRVCGRLSQLLLGLHPPAWPCWPSSFAVRSTHVSRNTLSMLFFAAARCWLCGQWLVT